MAKAKEKTGQNDVGYLEDADHVSELPEGGMGDGQFGAPSELQNPNFSPEDQEMEMQPAVVGPPAYASPDPTTNAGRLRPIDNHPLADGISEDYGQDVVGAAVSPGEEHPGEPGAGEPGTLEGDLQGSAEASYEEQTKAELMELASEREIEGRSDMSKSELVTAHEAYDEEHASGGPES